MINIEFIYFCIGYGDFYKEYLKQGVLIILFVPDIVLINEKSIDISENFEQWMKYLEDRDLKL